MSDVWYFAYGSNMSVDRKRVRTGLIRKSHRAMLRDYRLAFNKAATGGGVYANIVESDGTSVWGVIYLCDPAAMAELDRREGVMGGHYERTTVTVELDGGTKETAETYVAGQKYLVSEGSPTDEYLDFIVTGAGEHGLPSEYIQAVQRLARKQEES